MPFMDHRVVEFLFSLPDESRVGAGYTKRVLRLAAQGLVPDNTRLNRVKMGFNAPLVEWFSGPLRDWLRDVLSDSRCRQSPHFDGRFIARRFESWLESPSWNQAWQFWPPVHYVLWMDEVRRFGRPGAVRAPTRCA